MPRVVKMETMGQGEGKGEKGHSPAPPRGVGPGAGAAARPRWPPGPPAAGVPRRLGAQPTSPFALARAGSLERRPGPRILALRLTGYGLESSCSRVSPAAAVAYIVPGLRLVQRAVAS